MVTTVLNFFVGHLVLFKFTSYGIESFFEHGYYWFILLTVVVALWGVHLLLKGFFTDDLPPAKVWGMVGIMAVAVISMAVLRHGMRLSLVAPAMAQSIEKSDQFQLEALAAFEASKEELVAVSDSPPGRQLAEKHGCLACHNETDKLVGPAYVDVAARHYSAQQIVELVYSPKPENWPDYTPMPPMPQVPKEDIKQIATWINSMN
jgi:cytochrome c